MNSKTNEKRSFSIGKLLTDSGKTANDFEVRVDDLKKHVLVCGGTGSGKTVTITTILKHLWSQGIPFLLIQPDKAEHRGLILNDESFKQEGAIYTVGNETVSPLKVNPFQVFPGFPVGRHLEALKTIFDACFEMYAPMPHVLEKALAYQYELKGWNLGVNKNHRLPAGKDLDDPRYAADLFPTVGELSDSIEPLTETFGYSDRIGPDVIAALKARIGSLISTNKGNVFNVKTSSRFDQIFRQPTVIELQEFFSVSEKAFFLSLLLLQLYEYRSMRPASQRLQHVLVIEDSHRLLNKQALLSTNKQTGPTFAHLFADLLCQLGAYGQGVIICTQTPGQLMPELLSNTGLKIVHRLVTSTDLDAVSCSTYLGEAERRHIAALSTGQAFVYAEEMLHPNHLIVESALGPKITSMISDVTPADSNRQVREAMRKYAPPIWPAHFADYGALDEDSVPSIMEIGNIVARDPAFNLVFHRFVMSMQNDLTQLVHFRANIIHEVQRLIGRFEHSYTLSAITWCALVQATERYFSRKGEVGRWNFDEVQEQKERFFQLLKPAFVIDPGLPPSERPRMQIEVLRRWRDDLAAVQKVAQGPLAGCLQCTSKCLYRFEVSEVVRDPLLKFDFNSAINRSDEKASVSAAWFCRLLSERLIGQTNIDLAHCLAVHFIKEQQLSEGAQLVMLNSIREHLQEMIASPNAESPVEAPSTATVGEPPQSLDGGSLDLGGTGA